METARRARRQHPRALPLPLLLVLSLLLFSAGLGAGWSGATAFDHAVPEKLGAAAPNRAIAVLSPAQTTAPAPDKPSPILIPAEESWKLMLINSDNPLPEGFIPHQTIKLQNGHEIDSRVYPALQRMMDAARAEGLRPLICSSSRSWDTQAQLYEAEVQRFLNQGYARDEAEAQAAMWVVRPGASEHQAGLAVDIVDLSYQVLDEGQESTPVQQWLIAHCAEYGFILRYPTAKSTITGVGYEPWHYRYVGEEAAQEIMANGLCLEEYLSQ